jgi:hypothetical protein
MALIDQQEAAKLIRQNKDTHEDCQGAIHYNIGCEHSAQIVEQMKELEIIHCKDCVYHNWDIVDGPYGLAQEIHWCDKLYDGPGESLAVLPSYHFCAWGDRKGKKNGNVKI